MHLHPLQIGTFNPVLRVIESKQHPRRLIILGSDGVEYGFLLKGHEDIRQVGFNHVRF
jgi:FKBP12-rapamycin complex-associated protein